MSNVIFSQAIVNGLHARGFTDARILRILGTSRKNLELVVAGKKHFSDAAIAKIEDATGLTGGQLAALALEPRGGPLTRLMDEWSTIQPSAPVRRSAARRT